MLRTRVLLGVGFLGLGLSVWLCLQPDPVKVQINEIRAIPLGTPMKEFYARTAKYHFVPLATDGHPIVMSRNGRQFVPDRRYFQSAGHEFSVATDWDDRQKLVYLRVARYPR